MRLNGSLMRMSRPLTVLVEGNIGAGKSLFLSKFQGLPGVQVLQEPVNKWRDLNGSNLLQLMYEDPVRWSLTFQTYVQLTMLEQHIECSSPVKLMERSIFSARYCFVTNLKNTGKLQETEFEVLNKWFEFLISSPQFDLGIDLIVYLKTCPKIAYERLKKRKRGEENLISLQYIKDLHELHEDWLERGRYPIPAPIITIDADKDEHLLLPDVITVKTKIDEIMKERERQTNHEAEDELRKQDSG